MGWGLFLVILGIGSFILPHMGYQFKLLMLFGEHETIAGVASLVIGLGIIAFNMMRSPRNADSSDK